MNRRTSTHPVDKWLATVPTQAMIGSMLMRARAQLFSPSCILAMLLATGTAAKSYATSATTPKDAYEAAVDMDFRQAGQLAAHAGTGAEADFARALLLLNEQPKTAGKIDQARALFEQFWRAHPQDPLGVASLYFLARIEHTHATPVNRQRAEELYRTLMNQHPASPYAERAFLFYAILRQHAAEALPAKRAELLALDADAELRLKSPVAQRLYHLTAGLAWSRLLQDDDRALAHHLRVYALRLESDYEFANLLARIAELYRRRGETANALRFYREFLQWAPADRRSGLVAEWIRYLEKGGVP